VIYEVRRRICLPGAAPKLEAVIERRLDARTRYSPLGAVWHSEIGTMNQVLEIWPYESLAEMERVHDSLPPELDRPPDELALLVTESTEVWSPATFMPSGFDPHVYGGIFELRTYTFRPGTMPMVLEVWARMAGPRHELSPLVGAWVPVLGAPPDRLCHVWAYPDLNERARIRALALEMGIWPPLTREWRIGEQSEIFLPASFSPIR
jgi:hypothetical protein